MKFLVHYVKVHQLFFRVLTLLFLFVAIRPLQPSLGLQLVEDAVLDADSLRNERIRSFRFLKVQ